MKMSNETTEIFCAFSLFQSEVEDVKRDTKSYKGMYATLDQVIQVRKVLSKFGLAITQMIGDCSNGYIELENVVTHKTGQYFSEIMKMPVGEVPKGISMAQHIGSNISYARRYGILSLVGMAQEDNDAELPQAKNSDNVQKNQNYYQNIANGPKPGSTIDLALINQLKELIALYNIEDSSIDLWKKKFNVNHLYELNENQAKAIIGKIITKFESETKSETKGVL